MAIPKIATREELMRTNDILGRAFLMLRVKNIYDRQWPRYERSWKMTIEGRQGEDAWRADLPESWSFATVKTAQAAFIDSKVIPTIIRHEDDPTSKAEDLKDLYIDIADKGNLDLELYYARLDALKIGNGFTKTIYRKDTRTVWEIDKFDPETDEFKWKKKQINDFDDPHTRRVSPYLILKDDLARADWSTCRDLIELEVMGRDDAREKYGHLVDFDRIPQTAKVLFKRLTASSTTRIAETDSTGLRNTEFENLSKYHFFAPGFDWSNDVVEIIHYWNKAIKVPSGANESYEILINGYPVQVDLKNKPSPIPYIHKQIPYTHFMYSPYSGDEAWAAGIIEIGKSDADAIKKNREKMDDRQSLSLFSPAFSDVNDEIDTRVLKLKPMSIIRTKGGTPKQWTIPGISTGDLAMLDRHEASFKRSTGIDERLLGNASESGILTATEISFIRESNLRRMRDFAFLYKNALLYSEIRLKLSLFKQYFSNPLSKEKAQKGDTANRILKNKFKEFKVISGDTYIKKQIIPSYFEGDIDVDLSLEVLMPMTPAQMVTVWSQILRDAVPFVQAGIIDLSLKKVFGKYVEALGTNMESLRERKDTLPIQMAESEHQLYADPNTSASMKDILPNGTDKKFLSAEHLNKHEELLDSDINIENTEKARLLKHIQQDINNWKSLQVEQAKPNLGVLTPQNIQSVGGLPPTRTPIATSTPVAPPIETVPIA